MNVLWVFPDKEQCGISIYSKEYCNSLRSYINIDTANPSDYIDNRTSFAQKVNNSDIVHIQYDTTFYYNNNFNFFRQLTNSIDKPKIIQLHEIYDEFPLVFPRNKIVGIWPLKLLKRYLYDLRHPIQTDFRRHLQKMFYSDRILVHYNFQKDIILKANGSNPDIVGVIPHMVMNFKKHHEFSPEPNPVLHLGSTGFITPHYNYDLLFSVLEKIDIPWRFTWIGGLRLPEHENVLNDISARIEQHGWKDKFIITGFVTETDQQKHLQHLDIYLALFSHRSSSGSLCRAIASHTPVITTDLPLTMEINRSVVENTLGPLHIADTDPNSVIDGIKRMTFDNSYRNRLLHSLVLYAEKNDISKTTTMVLNLYHKLIKS